MLKYKKVKTIGKGSFGYAVLVRNVDEPQNLYVMKMIDIQKMSSKQQQEALNEIEVLKKLDNPFIIKYKESFIEKKVLCIVMDFADGGDLYNLINEYKKTRAFMPEPLVRKIFTQLALGLLHVHTNRILHRDLKTQNIFLTKQQNVKLGDFGISRVLQHTYDVAKTAIGTPYYLSPEICQERSYNHKSDVWSIGCILYEMLSLNHAFDGASMKQLILRILEGTYPPPPPHYSKEIKELLGLLLKTNPEERPSAYDLLQTPMMQAEIRTLEREHGRFKELISANKLNRNKSSDKIRPGQPLAKDKRSKSYVDIKEAAYQTKKSMKKFEILKKGGNKGADNKNTDNERKEQDKDSGKIKILSDDVMNKVPQEKANGNNERPRIYYNFDKGRNQQKETSREEHYSSESTNIIVSNDKFSSNNRSSLHKAHEDPRQYRTSQDDTSNPIKRDSVQSNVLKTNAEKMDTIMEEKSENKKDSEERGIGISEGLKNNNKLLLKKFNIKPKTPDTNPSAKITNIKTERQSRSFISRKYDVKPLSSIRENPNTKSVLLPSRKLTCNYPNAKNTDQYEPLEVESPEKKQYPLFNYQSNKAEKDESGSKKRVYSSLNINQTPSNISVAKQINENFDYANDKEKQQVDSKVKKNLIPKEKDKFTSLEDQPLKSSFLFDCLPYKLDKKDTITYKIEALKIYLEKELTLERLLFIYNGLKEAKPLDKLNAIEDKFLPFINQLVFLEDQVYLNNLN